MKLFLASEATNEKTLKDIEKFIGGSFENKKILFIPTAANGESYKSWQQSNSWRIIQSLGAQITLLELEEEKNLDFDKLSENDIIWFAGGMSAYLAYWIRRRKLDIYLQEWLEREMIYVGSSSGSMVASKTLFSSEIFLGEEEYGASKVPGLGLVDFEIYPHFEEDQFNQIEKLWKSGKLYLIKDSEAIIKDGESIKVIGVERIIAK